MSENTKKQWMELLKQKISIEKLFEFKKEKEETGKYFLTQNELTQINKRYLNNIEKEYQTPGDDIEPKIISVIDEQGKQSDFLVVIAFSFKDNGKEYVVYTAHERDKHNNITAYVSEVSRADGKPVLIGVEDEKDWQRVRQALKEFACGNPEAPSEYDESGIEII